MTTFYAFHDSPIGPLLLTATERGLSRLYMDAPRYAPLVPHPEWREDAAQHAPQLAQARTQLDEYFAGRRTQFEIALDLHGTPFQQSVWRALMDIDYGETISYGELARRIANPKAVRAVGWANGRNPVSIVVPCHRVIGADGSLTGYGGGVDRKQFLLELEARHARTEPRAAAQAELALL